MCTLFGYGMGWNAPGIANRRSFLQAAHHVNLAHGEAVRTLRALAPGALLGAIHNRQVCLPISAKPEDAVAANLLDACWNRLYADPQILAEYPPELIDGVQEFVQAGDMARIAQPIDWFGLNHYCPIYARADQGPLGFAWADAPHDVPLTGVGWRIDPDAFRNELIAAYRRYKLPIYVTENGYGANETLDAAGGVNDGGRIAYLADYTRAVEQAVASGADVRGYFLWSLLDNLEWGAGYASRFGHRLRRLRDPEACSQGVLRLVCEVDPGAAGGNAMIEGWVTRDAKSLLQPLQPVAFSRSAPQESLPTIEIDDSRTFQPIEGFGFSLTGGSAYLLAGLAAAERADLLQELFGSTEESVGLSCLRLSIGASDLGRKDFSYWGLRRGTKDPDLARFNLSAGDREVVPVLQEILAINPAVKIIASPWSAPPWMKSNGSYVAGRLKPECYSAYARYFVKYVETMRAHGIHVSAVTPQNEPQNPRNEPSMVMSATEQADFIKGYLGPELRKGAPETEILCWDHNCDGADFPLAVLGDAEARAYIAGVAWHLYNGSPEAMSHVQAQYPEQESVLHRAMGFRPGRFHGRPALAHEERHHRRPEKLEPYRAGVESRVRSPLRLAHAPRRRGSPGRRDHWGHGQAPPRRRRRPGRRCHRRHDQAKPRILPDGALGAVHPAGVGAGSFERGGPASQRGVPDARLADGDGGHE